MELIPAGDVEEPDTQQMELIEYKQETRGRKEMELDDYRTHVNTENDRNDSEIVELRIQKDSAYGLSKTELAESIAKIMREKTTRCRRLRDRERFLI